MPSEEFSRGAARDWRQEEDASLWPEKRLRSACQPARGGKEAEGQAGIVQEGAEDRL